MVDQPAERRFKQRRAAGGEDGKPVDGLGEIV